MWVDETKGRSTSDKQRNIAHPALTPLPWSKTMVTKQRRTRNL